MTVIRPFIFVFVAMFSFASLAYQDDARVLLRRPTALFSGNVEGETGFLTAATARGNFGAFIYSDEFHAWKFGVGLDTAALSFGENALWRIGANFDALADGRSKDFSFRLGQTHYEVFTAFEFKIDESVIYLGHRHRCRHAADDTPARIVMKTGPEVGFNGFFTFGRFELTTASSALLYLAGQNADLSHQHRFNISNAVQLEYLPNDTIGVFAGAGLSTIWVSASTLKEYTIFTETLSSEVRLSPGAALGVNLKGRAGEFKVYMAYNSNLDAGFRALAEQTHIASINGEFWY